MQRPVRDMLQSVSDRVSLHMPASQGQALFEGMDPYRLETTELPVTDDVYHPAHAILEAEKLLAKSAKTKVSFLLCGGSTAGIHAMILYACKRGDTILLPRNVHVSALHICAIAGIESVFADIEETPEGWLYTTPEAYQKALKMHPYTKAALVISSDYFGLLSDVQAIARVVHQYGIPLFCDEAHGAYFNWRQDIANAGALGADVFVQSAHKTLPSINAAAWLHCMDGVDENRMRTILRMVQTSSPSFTLMQVMDDTRAWMDMFGQDACEKLLQAMEEFRAKAAVLGYTDDQKQYPADRLRLVLKAPQGGERLQQQLQKLGIDVEMSDTDHIVCILSLLDGEKRLHLLLAALAKLQQNTVVDYQLPAKLALCPSAWPTRQLSLSDAVFAESELVEPAKSVGRISASNVGLYPPGVAWLTAGETITQEIVHMITHTPRHRLFGISGGIRCVK